MNSLAKIAARLVSLENRVKSQARTPQLAHSSLDNGAIAEFNSDGALMASYGQQLDGTHGAVTVNGPRPPAPTDPVVEPGQGSISVTWDGYFQGGQVRPLDLDFVRVLVADNEDMTGASTAALLVASGSVVVNLPQGIYYVTLVAESKPGRESYPTDPVVVEVLALSAEDIADGAIVASKLERDLVLATNLIAGNPAGQHARLDPEGFRAFASPATPGEAPRTVVRLGVDGSKDVLSLLGADNQLAASINDEGVFSGKDMNLSGQLFVGGESLHNLLTRPPNGLVGWGAQYSDPPPTNGQMGVFEISVPLRGDRMYEISTSPIRIYSNTADSKQSLRVRYTSSPSGSTPATPWVGSIIMAQAEELYSAPNYQSLQINKIVNMPGGNYRLLLVYSADSGGAAQMVGSGEFPIELWVKDIGPYTPNLQVPNQGGGQVNAPAATQYTKQWAATGIMSYDGANNQYQNGYMFQGLSPAGWGNLKSLATFPDLTGELAGATINNVRVYFNFVHWYNNAGGTAYIGVHGHAGIPGTFAAPGAVASSGGWPKPGARWVDLPISVWNNFKSGASRGVSLEGDGSLGTYGYAQPPVLEITYTK